MSLSNSPEKSTIIGFFSESWDASKALEDLRFAGFEDKIRYVENDNITHADNSKCHPGVKGFFAKLYGFEDETEFLDSKNTITVSPEAEEYFTDVYHRKNHVILVRADEGDEGDKALEIISNNHGRVERQNFAFFNSVRADDDRMIEDGPHNIPPLFHPTSEIVPPRSI